MPVTVSVRTRPERAGVHQRHQDQHHRHEHGAPIAPGVPEGAHEGRTDKEAHIVEDVQDVRSPCPRPRGNSRPAAANVCGTRTHSPRPSRVNPACRPTPPVPPPPRRTRRRHQRTQPDHRHGAEPAHPEVPDGPPKQRGHHVDVVRNRRQLLRAAQRVLQVLGAPVGDGESPMYAKVITRHSGSSSRKTTGPASAFGTSAPGPSPSTYHRLTRNVAGSSTATTADTTPTTPDPVRARPGQRGADDPAQAEAAWKPSMMLRPYVREGSPRACSSRRPGHPRPVRMRPARRPVRPHGHRTPRPAGRAAPRAATSAAAGSAGCA